MGRLRIDEDFWRGRRVLVTGHTGFKGAWLSLWLSRLGALVTGLSNGVPTEPSLFRLAQLDELVAGRHVDVRDERAVALVVEETHPEVIFHLAAQPIVRRSLESGAETFATNVLGTVHVLEAARRAPPAALIVVTSDKVYADDGARRAFGEEDALGGSDPYSASKAAADLAAGAYRASFGLPVATARAGNVIGGGDWSEDRLVPDAVRAAAHGTTMLVRNPSAVRPWQHVLCPLGGYLMLAERLASDPWVARPWNFGPDGEDMRPVRWVLEQLSRLWGPALRWELDAREQPRETEHLAVDASAARELLGWRPPWALERALEQTVAWYRDQATGGPPRELALAQLDAFTREAAQEDAGEA